MKKLVGVSPNQFGENINQDISSSIKRKSSVGILVLALVVGGMSAHAAGVLNTASGGYLVCVNSNTKAVTYPAKTKCPKGFKKLILGAQGAAGLSGADGKTLLSGIKDPESTVGAPGDMFINTVTKTLFGPKNVDGTWPLGFSMVGPQGPGGSGSVGPAGPAGPAGAAGSNATLSCAQGGTCVIGDTGPGGGIVFYVQTATAAAPWRYMEAAPGTWSGNSGGVNTDDLTMIWCSNTTAFVASLATGSTATISTSTSIGAGARNTKLMLGSCTFGAANVAASYNGGGKSDWFLPSKDELNQLYSQKITVGGRFIPNGYWSSSEATATNSSYQDFGASLYQDNISKNTSIWVRPVRAF